MAPYPFYDDMMTKSKSASFVSRERRTSVHNIFEVPWHITKCLPSVSYHSPGDISLMIRWSSNWSNTGSTAAEQQQHVFQHIAYPSTAMWTADPSASPFYLSKRDVTDQSAAELSQTDLISVFVSGVSTVMFLIQHAGFVREMLSHKHVLTVLTSAESFVVIFSFFFLSVPIFFLLTIHQKNNNNIQLTVLPNTKKLQMLTLKKTRPIKFKDGADSFWCCESDTIFTLCWDWM